MIGSFSQYKLGNLKLNRHWFCSSFDFIFTFFENYSPTTSRYSLFIIDNFDITKNLLIMIVFAFLMIATSGFYDSKIKKR
jgi:hypothetical protein